MYQKIIWIIFIIVFPVSLSAQLTYGTTGLLHVPSAEMQPDKTVMAGFNFMNRELTPPRFDYHTYNYYLNFTLFPCLEVAYTCTLFTGESLGVKSQRHFTNQDRYFSARLRLVKEYPFFPAIVVGTSDPFTSSGHKFDTQTGNGYFSRFFIAATKNIHLKGQSLGIHLSYLYNRRFDYPLNGIAGGITYTPSILPQLRVIAEYDTKDFAMGLSCLFFRHLVVQAELQSMKYFTGGIAYKIFLK